MDLCTTHKVEGYVQSMVSSPRGGSRSAHTAMHNTCLTCGHLDEPEIKRIEKPKGPVKLYHNSHSGIQLKGGHPPIPY